MRLQQKIAALVFLASSGAATSQTVPFARDGGLKMLYDNRVYPQAVAVDGTVHLVWRDSNGLPRARSYDLRTRRFSPASGLLDGLGIEIDASKYRRDHHFAPVIWLDRAGRLHTLFGCHHTPGIHLVSRSPGHWEEAETIAESISYPKVHRIAGGRTLVYYRHSGHLGYWTYRISDDGSRGWQAPERPLVDLDAIPRDGRLADISGSYHTTAVSRDGRTLHVAFIWKLEEPVPNTRYRNVLGDHLQRYNLYYLKVDLESGKASNGEGAELSLPVNKAVADRDCLVWDTQERSASVGPSIYLDEQDKPYFLLPVSEETPYRSRFYLVRHRGGQWVRTVITSTGHPFNSGHLERNDDGGFRAFVITAGGETIPSNGLNEYGWGDRIEEWVSDSDGEHWKLLRDLTPPDVARVQNIQFVSQGMNGILRDVLLFYGWNKDDTRATGYLWDNRPR